MVYTNLDTKSCIGTVATGGGSGKVCNDPLKIGCISGIPNTYVAAGVILLGIMILKQ